MAEHKIRQALRCAAEAVIGEEKEHFADFAVMPLESRVLMSTVISDEPVAATLPLSSVPALHSRPGATAKLYLDFNGDNTGSWGTYSPGNTPAYDFDGNTSSFSDAEIAAINEIWARVSEKYSPFNLDVTTVDPGTLSERVAGRIVVGGNGSWTGGTYGGLTYTGGFYGGGSNTGFAFSSNLGSNPQMVGEVISHESGHLFGLAHQKRFDGNGRLVEEYHGSDDGLTAPVMGNSYGAQRGIWFYGTAGSATTFQDDLAILSNMSTNAFGYRADDYGNSSSGATAVQTSGGAFSITGVIEKMADADYFSFSTTGGTLNFNGAVAPFGPTLNLKLELRASSGSLIATADTATLGETLSLNVAAGTYYITVASHGSYGDLGQYTLSMTSITAPTVPPSAPGNLNASLGSSVVSLSWSDNSSDEDGFTIQRSSDGGSTWANLTTLGANATSFQEAIPTGTTWTYRVSAYNSAGASGYSNTASVNNPVPVVPPTAPSNLFASLANSVASLSWSDNSNNETGFTIQRSTNGGSTWSNVTTVAANVTSYQDTLPLGAVWSYRVNAYNSQYQSPYSNSVSVNNPLPVTPPAAPSGLTTNMMDLTATISWIDNSNNETGFLLERSDDGNTWISLGAVDANVTSYQDGVWMGQAFEYRVQAINSLYSSSFSNEAWVMNPMPTSAPQAPINVTATISSGGTASVDWDAGSHDAIGYSLSHSVDGGATWQIIHQVIVGHTGFDEDLPVGVTAMYRVSAFNPVGNSAHSAVVSVTHEVPVLPPAAPSNLSVASTTLSEISLVWSPTVAASHYVVERSSNGVNGWSEIADTTATIYSDTGLTSGATFYYRVFALNEGGRSDASSIVSGTTQTPVIVAPPAAPTNLSVTVSNRGRVTLNWTDNSNNEDGFYIERSTDGQTWTTTSVTMANVTTDVSTPYRKTRTTYFFRVRAFNAAGASDYTNTVSTTLGAGPSAGAVTTAKRKSNALLTINNPVYARVMGNQTTILRLLSNVR